MINNILFEKLNRIRNVLNFRPFMVYGQRGVSEALVYLLTFVEYQWYFGLLWFQSSSSGIILAEMPVNNVTKYCAVPL